MKKKRLASLVLVFALLTSLIIPAKAAGSFSLSVTKDGNPVTNVNAGDTVTVTITSPEISQADIAGGIGIWLTFDKDKFQMTGTPTSQIPGCVVATDVTDAATANLNGWVKANSSNVTAGMNAGDIIVSATFTATAAGTANFGVTIDEMTDEEGGDSKSGYSAPSNVPIDIVSVLTGPQTITMVKRPVVGNSVTDPEAATIEESSAYTSTFFGWKKDGENATGTFAAEATYTATGVLNAKSGYKFASDANVALAGAKEGESVTLLDVASSGACLRFTYQYTTPGLPSFEYTPGAPAVSSKAGGDVTLNLTSFEGQTIEYGWSHSADKATADHWQESNGFTGLEAGDYYFFMRIKAKAGVHCGGPTSNASAMVTVFAAPQITGYGSLDSLAIGTPVDVSPTVNAPAGVATTNPYSITGTLPAGLSFSQADGKITGTPTTYSAAGGSVTVTVTDAEGIVSAAYTLNYGPVAKKANTMDAVTQADVAYGTAVDPSATSNGNAPTFAYKFKGADDGTYSATKPTAVGEYTVKASSTGHATVADKTVTADFAITPKTLNDLDFSGVTVTKVYDGTTSAGAVGGSAITFTGKVGTDDVSIKAVAGAYADANAGTGKTVTLTLSLDGADKDNYALASDTQPFTAAAITPADYTYVVGEAQTFPTYSGLSAITVAPEKGTGVNGEPVDGTLGWYTDGACNNPANDYTLRSVAVNSSMTLYWKFTASNGNYTTTSKKGSTVFTAKNIAFTVNVAGVDQPATAANAVTLKADPTYGDTWAEIVTIKSDSIVAKVGTTVVTGTYSLDVTGSPNAGSGKSFKVLFTSENGTYVNVEVCSGTVDVAAKSISGATVQVGGAYTYTGAALTPDAADVTVTLDGVTLNASDYTFEASNNTNAGTATVTVTGQVNYAGTATGTFTIGRKAITVTPDASQSKTYGESDPALTYTLSDALFSGDSMSGALSRAAGENAGTYAITLGTLSAGANYTLSLSETPVYFTIAPKAIAASDFTKLETADKTYTGSALTQTIESELTLGTDYTVAYENNTNAGTAKYTVTGQGNYTGSIEKNFTITAAAYDLSKLPTTLNIGKTYTAATIEGAVKNAGTAEITAIAVQKSDGTPVDDPAAAAAIATLEDGVVKAVGAGKVVITYSIGAKSVAGDDTPEYAAVSAQTVTVTLSAAPVYGGGGGIATYSITVDSAKNGTVTADAKTAAKGADVTLTVTPNKGYTLETLTVTDGSGKEVKLTEKNGKYTFTMPASKVTVKATFMEDNSMLNFFVDVPADAYYYDAVLWAAENGITGGVDDTHFAPNATCTRAQAVTFLWRAAGSPAPKSSMMPFTDVPAGSYYETAVLWAVENGITKGTSDTMFSPDATCTRAQIVTFLWRANGSPAVSGNSAFTDVASDAYYAAAVTWAEKNDVTGGIGGGLFGSNNNCTRAQIVTFIYRSVK